MRICLNTPRVIYTKYASITTKKITHHVTNSIGVFLQWPKPPQKCKMLHGKKRAPFAREAGATPFLWLSWQRSDTRGKAHPPQMMGGANNLSGLARPTMEKNPRKRETRKLSEQSGHSLQKIKGNGKEAIQGLTRTTQSI